MSGLAPREVLRRQFEVFGERGSGVNIGLRQALRPEGRSGHVRVDTVHQGTATASKA